MKNLLLVAACAPLLRACGDAHDEPEGVPLPQAGSGATGDGSGPEGAPDPTDGDPSNAQGASIAGFPHMHLLGSAMRFEVGPSADALQEVYARVPFDFDDQRIEMCDFVGFAVDLPRQAACLEVIPPVFGF